MDISGLQDEFELEIAGATEEGHSHTTFLGTYRGKKAVIKHAEDERSVRENEALQIVEDTGIKTPEVLKYAEKKGDHILITELVNSSFPDREKWKDIDFCRRFVDSAADILKEIHSSKIMDRASQKTHIPQNRDRALNAMTAKNSKIRAEVKGDIPDLCDSITRDITSEHVFTHGDFSTENILISDNGIEAVIDWAEAGFTSRLRDIALFESSFIDEYLRFFHPEKVKEIRQKFRTTVKPEDRHKLELYRFHQNAVVLAYIRRGRCSEEWRKVGSVQEIEKHRKKVLEQDIDMARKALKAVNSR